MAAFIRRILGGLGNGKRTCSIYKALWGPYVRLRAIISRGVHSYHQSSKMLRGWKYHTCTTLKLALYVELAMPLKPKTPFREFDRPRWPSSDHYLPCTVYLLCHIKFRSESHSLLWT